MRLKINASSVSRAPSDTSAAQCFRNRTLALDTKVVTASVLACLRLAKAKARRRSAFGNSVSSQNPKISEVVQYLNRARLRLNGEFGLTLLISLAFATSSFQPWLSLYLRNLCLNSRYRSGEKNCNWGSRLQGLN